MWLKIGYPNIPKFCDLFFLIIFSFKRSFSVGTRYPVKRHTPKSVSCTQKSGRGLNWSYFLGNSEALHFEPQAANMDARIWVLDGFGTVGQQRRLENSERVWNEYIYIHEWEKCSAVPWDWRERERVSRILCVFFWKWCDTSPFRWIFVTTLFGIIRRVPEV